MCGLLIVAESEEIVAAAGIGKFGGPWGETVECEEQAEKRSESIHR
jgi:hypothetical protein